MLILICGGWRQAVPNRLWSISLGEAMKPDWASHFTELCQLEGFNPPPWFSHVHSIMTCTRSCRHMLMGELLGLRK